MIDFEIQVRIVDIEKEAIYETDVLVMGTDGLWDVTSNERVAETVQRSLEQFPIEDDARYRYRFTSAAQDLVMSSRGKLNERSWRTSDNKSATIDDISVFVIPLAAYKEEYLRWKLEMESQNQRPSNSAVNQSTDSSSETKPDRMNDVIPKRGSSTAEEIQLDQEPSYATVSVAETVTDAKTLMEEPVAPISADPVTEIIVPSQAVMNPVIGQTDPDESK